MPVPTRWQRRDANLTIDQCKFEGDRLSPRRWDELGEQSPWWCTIDPYAGVGGNSYQSRASLTPGVSTGVVDGSEGPPLGSHRDVGGGSEGMLPGGPEGGVKKWAYPAAWAKELNQNFRCGVACVCCVCVLRVCVACVLRALRALRACARGCVCVCVNMCALCVFLCAYLCVCVSVRVRVCECPGIAVTQFFFNLPLK
jgi:hypothetical protein